jgi:quercetin dioxygenase-like cupin family protein
MADENGAGELPRAALLESGFDIHAMRRDLAEVADDLWTPILSDRRLAWHGVALRSADGDPRTMGYSPDCRDTELMDTLPALREVVAGTQGELRRVRLLALQPGAEIGEHVDEPAGEAREARLHAPITTNALASFVIDGEEIAMAPGELWWLNVELPHSAHNRGEHSRVHLVIDCVHGAWLDGRLR